MEATTRWRSSTEASFFDEQFDGSTAEDTVKDAASLGEEDVEGKFEAVVVEKTRLSSPEAAVGVVDVVEGADDAVIVDEGVGND